MSKPAEELFRHKWMALCKGLNDEPFVRGIGEGVVIVPINAQGEVLFTHEPAVHSGAPVLGLPSGTIENDEAPVVAANRELQEEIDFKGDQMDVLAALHPLVRHADWTVHAVLARDLVPSSLEGDEPHEIHIEPFPLDDFESLITQGRLKDSSCIAALFLARRFLNGDA